MQFSRCGRIGAVGKLPGGQPPDHDFYLYQPRLILVKEFRQTDAAKKGAPTWRDHATKNFYGIREIRRVTFLVKVLRGLFPILTVPPQVGVVNTRGSENPCGRGRRAADPRPAALKER